MIIINSFTTILNLMQQEGAKNNPPFVQIGTVKSIDPFSIAINDLVLYKEDLYIPYDLWESTFKGSVHIDGVLDGSTNSSFCTTEHTHTLGSATIKGDIIVNVEQRFEVGDLVALIPMENRQRYLLINKVVAM